MKDNERSDIHVLNGAQLKRDLSQALVMMVMEMCMSRLNAFYKYLERIPAGVMDFFETNPGSSSV